MKRIDFIKDLNIAFNKNNIAKLTGIPWKNWCEISGVYFTTPMRRRSRLVSDYEFEFSGKYPNLEMQAFNDNVSISLSFDIELNSIHVRLFQLKDADRRKGALAFRNHLSMSSKFGFKNITCYANGGKDAPQFNGYVTWGKFGFTMEQEYHEKFIEFIQKKKRSENCLQRLLRTNVGCSFWIKEGFPWKATFDLNEKSINQKIWGIYRRHRQLDKLFPKRLHIVKFIR